MLRVEARGSGSAVYGKPGPTDNYQRVGLSTGKICKRCPLLGYIRRDSRLVSYAADRWNPKTEETLSNECGAAH